MSVLSVIIAGLLIWALVIVSQLYVKGNGYMSEFVFKQLNYILNYWLKNCRFHHYFLLLPGLCNSSSYQQYFANFRNHQSRVQIGGSFHKLAYYRNRLRVLTDIFDFLHWNIIRSCCCRNPSLLSDLCLFIICYVKIWKTLSYKTQQHWRIQGRDNLKDSKSNSAVERFAFIKL